MEDCKEIVGRAYYGRKEMVSFAVPETVERIGDYAFASCDNLLQVMMPKKNLVLGKRLFYRDDKLDQICLYEIENESKDSGMDEISGVKKDALWRLLALSVRVLNADYLLNPPEVGNGDWYERLDQRMRDFLRESEEEAWKELVYCAEEDMEEKRKIALAERDRKRAECVLARLAAEDYLGKETKAELLSFLEQNLFEGVWKFISQKEDCSRGYCDILIKNGIVRQNNLFKCLEELGENNLPLKAYLLQIRLEAKEGGGEENWPNGAFFNNLTI